MTRELAVILPVYNEKASVRQVIEEWMAELDRWGDNYVLMALDDGSSDGSLDILRRLEMEFGPRISVITGPNRGHGQTCLKGYRLAAEIGAKYVLQIDSDGQCDPRYFERLWRLRDRFDVIYGVRTWRDDGLGRVFVSKVLRLFLLLAFRVNCPDANVPYRLMRVDRVIGAVNRIPAHFHLANVALAVLLARDRRRAHGYVPIGFRERRGGDPSVKAAVFGQRALELQRDLRRLFKDFSAG